MKAVFAATVLLAVMGAALAQSTAELAPQSTSTAGSKYWKDPIVAAKANNLTAFAQSVTDAELDPVLGVSNLTATVFAPSDAAFQKLADSTDPAVQEILANKEKLALVLKYHVVPGATIGSSRVKTMVQGTKNGLLPFKSLEGEKVNATLDGDSLLINGVKVSGSDVQGGKTMIHTIDEVLIPPSLASVAGATNATSKDIPIESPAPATSGAPAPSSGAAGVAATMLLAVPAIMAALL